jgi:hypothetical protein
MWNKNINNIKFNWIKGIEKKKKNCILILTYNIISVAELPLDH